MTYTLYISGPMTGLPEFNFPMFDRMAEFLRDRAFTPISPANHDRDQLRRNFHAGHTPYLHVHDVPGYYEGDVETYSKHTGAVHDLLSWDLQRIIEADGIVLLPGWENSTGAAHERYVAEVTNKRIFLAEFNEDGSINMVADYVPVRLSAHPKFVEREAADALLESAQRSAEEHLAACSVQLAEFNGGPDGRQGFTQADLQRDTVSARDYVDRVHAGVQEVRVVNEATGGEKGTKLARFDLLPVRPLFSVAEHYGHGAAKYAARNWERGYDWSLSFAAMMRHALAFWNGEDNDPELGTPHLAAVVFHAFSLMEFGHTHPELDDRSSSIAA